MIMDEGAFYIFWGILEAIRNGLAYTTIKFMLGNSSWYSDVFYRVLKPE